MVRASQSEAAPSPPLEWRVDVSLLGQPTMIAALVKVVVIAMAIMAALVAFLSAMTGDAAAIIPLLELTATCGAGVVVLLLLVVLVFYRNRMAMRFRVDDDGAQSAVVDRRAEAGAKAAVILGALAGSPGTVGAGLISASTSSQALRWGAVRRAVFRPRSRAIRLSNDWRTIMLLYCSPENYEAVAERVRNAMIAHPHIVAANPIPRLLLRTAIVVVAFLPLFNLPTPVRADPFAPFLTLCFALASIWLLPIFGWVVIGGLAWIGGAALWALLQPYHSTITGETFPSYGLLSGDDNLTIALALAAAAYLTWLSLALIRGRIESLLLRDMDDMETGGRRRRDRRGRATPPT